MASSGNVQWTIFNPQPPAVWDYDSIKKANEVTENYSCRAIFLKTIGLVGGVFTGYSIAKIAFGAAVLTSTVGIVAITSVAFICLGIYLSRQTNRHFKGLTLQIKINLAFEELKKGLNDLPKDKKFDIGFNAVKRANDIYEAFATPRYRPTLDAQPRFAVDSKHLTMMQMQDLLTLAYHKGIIIEFKQFEHYAKFDKVLPEDSRNVEKDFGKQCADDMKRAFECSLIFAQRRLMERQQPKTFEKGFDLDFVNKQLHAFGFKWEGKEGVKAMKPTVYFKDDSTVVIRGNCSEIANPSKSMPVFQIFDTPVNMLAPFVKTIIIPLYGLWSIDMLILPRNWEAFKSELTAHHGDKMRFIENEGKYIPEWNDIWQPGFVQEIGILDLMKDGLGELSKAGSSQQVATT